MKTLQRLGGISALYLAATYLIGIVMFLVVLDYPSLTTPDQRMALNVDKQTIIFASNLLMYVVFGLLLIVLMLALHDRMKSGAPALMQMATVVGMIWAGLLVASGTVANAGLALVVPLYASNPSQAATTWQSVEVVVNGLGFANGEILGGLLTLLVSVAALRTGSLPRWMNILGIFIGTAGTLSIIPGLTGLTEAYGLSKIVWFAWLGVTLLRAQPSNHAAMAQSLSPRATTGI